MPEKKPKSSSDCIADTAAAGYSLKEAGDFIERIKAMGASAIVVGDVSVRFSEPPAVRKKVESMTPQEIREWSA